MHPDETAKNNGSCPVCKKPVTVGVYSRVAKLSDRPEGFVPKGRVPYKSIVPLEEIIGEALDKGANTKGVQTIYEKMLTHSTEFDILLHDGYDEIASYAPPLIVEGIRRVREGKLSVDPGYDGEYGTVTIFSDKERKKLEQGKLVLGM
jgi:PHP family Zn ribbon phosphoesterase